MTKQQKLKYCTGCNENFYNGHNPLSIKECWSLKNAKIVQRKKIHINLVPPYDHLKKQKVLSCYRQEGYVFWDI
jgi:hypothetical protein